MIFIPSGPGLFFTEFPLLRTNRSIHLFNSLIKVFFFGQFGRRLRYYTSTMAPKRQAATAQKATTAQKPTKPREQPNGKTADASQGRKRKAPVEAEKAAEPVKSNKRQKGKLPASLELVVMLFFG